MKAVKPVTKQDSNWTRALRQRFGNRLPADHLLPDKQPTFVRSAVYLLGALAIGSLAIVILSGLVLAFFGPTWWHTSGVGHLINSVHLWSVEAFFFCMALHLWGMFFMGAWRDGRGRTWVMGALAFVLSIVAAFTGYLSQMNLDSQWIAVSAKDMFNSVGVGGFFNVLNFGQMYGLHVVLLPLGLLALVGIHVLLVRLRGVVRPYPAKGEQRTPYTKGMTQEQYYRGVRMAPYDLVRELTLVSIGALIVILVLASAVGSPDDKPLTLQGVAQDDPAGFVTVALSELAGDSVIAQYGPPYTTGDGSVQSIGPFAPQQLAGVSQSLDTAQVYVLGPLATVHNPDIAAALKTFAGASADQQAKWEGNYADALAKSDGTIDDFGHIKVADGDYGPLPVMFGALLDVARSGALDGLLLADGTFYQTDYTRPLLFLNEKALPDRAQELHLLGNQWGMMNETGQYPGQAWLWLYTMWYQVPAAPFNGPNADVAVAAVMLILTLALVFLPYVPVLNRLPERLGVYRLIWRRHYRELHAQIPSATRAADRGSGRTGPTR
jgi:quinol-cytochrome oxidoreductase complex cytochrome b subunit